MSGMICLWCGDPLYFSREKGWVHPDGKTYKTSFNYPRICRKCLASIHEGFCCVCGHQYNLEEVDDHCVLPVRGEVGR